MKITKPKSLLLFVVSGAAMTTLVCWLVFSLQSNQQRARYEMQIDTILPEIAQRLANAQVADDVESIFPVKI